MAGAKVVRLYEPEVGRKVFERVRTRVGGKEGSERMRGEEMMAGEEKEELEREVWGGEEVGKERGWQVVLGRGEGVFIPTGWWHSIRGVGDGITASVYYANQILRTL
ncbi:hypothetical protein BDY21DRAFT_334439 [Lineolata rhizophorae]|uniref:JmjC domain-containing protein n=1 Tax=Lineolata rhizophorae TaxID=578093 RepID=A0A6A6PB22_9PEZI|nr:hypothetical protein BDY21DRAFT_334439 [Lineolata rhizophorae]